MNRSIRPWTVPAAVRAFWPLEKPEMFEVALISSAPSGCAVIVMRVRSAGDHGGQVALAGDEAVEIGAADDADQILVRGEGLLEAQQLVVAVLDR